MGGSLAGGLGPEELAIWPAGWPFAAVLAALLLLQNLGARR